MASSFCGLPRCPDCQERGHMPGVCKLPSFNKALCNPPSKYDLPFCPDCQQHGHLPGVCKLTPLPRPGPPTYDWNKPMFPPTPSPPRAARAKATPPPPPPPPNRFTATANRFAALSSADLLSVSDESDRDSDNASDYNEGALDPQLLAEFDELVRYNDELQEFATKQFAAHPNPCFKHPLQYALHLMKLGLATLFSPPSEPTPTLAECSVQATPEPAPHAPPPPHADCGVQTTPMPAPTPTPPPPVQKLRRPASPVPRLTKTRSSSPSTRATFDKILAQLSTLQKEVSPPPSPPPTPRSASPAPCTEDCTIIIAVPYGTTSLSVDRLDQAWSFKIAAPPPLAPAPRGRSPRGRPLAASGTSVSAPHESGHQGPPRAVSVSF